MLGNTSEIAAAFDSSAAQSTSRFAYIPEHSSSDLLSSTSDKQGNGLTRPIDALLGECEDRPRHSVDDLLNDIVLNEGRDTPVGQLIDHGGDDGEQVGFCFHVVCHSGFRLATILMLSCAF